ncbi:hypothetical protein M433DRAFT_175854 [Acidomyces richmondensis BFW]|nr:hypothetical protein M433DRAFT_175854 [Acidomyces richmondensis BFW]
MSFTRGALVEPLAVVLHAISLCNGALAIGRPALICGAGPIGLIALAVAKASGAWPLVITDVDSGRLEFAKAFVQGVSTFQIDPTASSSQVADAIRHTFGQEEETAPSIVLECTGVESSIITGVRCCRRSGTVMVIGVGLETMNNLPFMHISLAEINLRFTNRYTRVDWVAGINALANNNVLNLDKLVTHTFPLEQALEAMQTCTDRSSKSIKVQIVDDTVIEL